MIYAETSVVLAQLLAEDRRPNPELWSEVLVSSRLLEYETWNRIHARKLGPSHGEAARQLIARISLVELHPLVLTRAVEPFPIPVRTLDAFHLASVEFLRGLRLDVRLASYDERMNAAARRLRIPLVELGSRVRRGSSYTGSPIFGHRC